MVKTRLLMPQPLRRAILCLAAILLLGTLSACFLLFPYNCRTCSDQVCNTTFGETWNCDIRKSDSNRPVDSVRVVANSEEEAQGCALQIAERYTTCEVTAVCAKEDDSTRNCRTTCDGEPCGESTKPFTFGLKDPATKCVEGFADVKANSRTKAEACIRGRECIRDQDNKEPVDPATVKRFHFARYLRQEISRSYECIIVSVSSTSSSDGRTCAAFVSGCDNCTYRDITSEVGDSETALNNYCTTHPSP